MFIFTAIYRILNGLWSLIKFILLIVYLMLWDLTLNVLNLLTFKRKVGHVIPQGKPGYRGLWPEYIPPSKNDSRSPCPALNAMANHGIIPRDGRNIRYTDLNKAIRATYNLSPSVCYILPKSAAGFFTRDYSKDTVDLGDICVHNIIEHDASLTRKDTNFQLDQGMPDDVLCDELLSAATGKNGTITMSDFSKVSDRRRREARASNGMYTMDTFHRFFGSANCAFMYTVFGGRRDDLKVVLKEERLPEGWEPRGRNIFGTTLATLHAVILYVELGITTIY